MRNDGEEAKAAENTEKEAESAIKILRKWKLTTSTNTPSSGYYRQIHTVLIGPDKYKDPAIPVLGEDKEEKERYKQISYLKEMKGKEAKMVIAAGGKWEKVLDGGGDGHLVFSSRNLFHKKVPYLQKLFVL